MQLHVLNNRALHYDELVPVEIEQHDRCCSNVGCHVMNDSALHYNEIEHHTYLDALLSSLSTFPPSVDCSHGGSCHETHLGCDLSLQELAADGALMWDWGQERFSFVGWWLECGRLRRVLFDEG